MSKLIKPFLSHLYIRSEKPLLTLRIDGTNNVLKRSNNYFNKCIVFLTLSKEWTDSPKFIEDLSVSLQTLPLFVIMVHSEDDRGWDDPSSIISRLQFPILHLTHKKVRICLKDLILIFLFPEDNSNGVSNE